LIGSPESSAPDLRITFFLAISLVAFGIGQFLVLSFINYRTARMRGHSEDRSSSDFNNSESRGGTSNRSTSSHDSFLFQIRIIHAAVLALQIVLSAILVTVIVLIVFASHYYTVLLTASTVISYSLAVVLTTLLAYSFFEWFKSNKNWVVFSYGLASAAIAINLALTVVFMTAILVSKPIDVMDHLTTIWPTFDPTSPMGILNSAYVVSGIAAFTLMWISTALLLKHHSKRLGKIKYWTIVSIPLAYFLSQFVLPLLLNQILASLLNADPVLVGIVLTLVFSVSKPAGAILFGVAFWAISKAVEANRIVRDYMIISAMGIVLLFVSSEGSVISATYPPFGLVSVSFVGLSSYMMFIGLYFAAISLSEDIRLRQLIRDSAITQTTRLLDSIGVGQMQKEIESRVLKIVKQQQKVLTEQTGVEPSISEDDMKEYLELVIKEVKGKQK
jgi:hypothetical protein